MKKLFGLGLVIAHLLVPIGANAAPEHRTCVLIARNPSKPIAFDLGIVESSDLMISANGSLGLRDRDAVEFVTGTLPFVFRSSMVKALQALHRQGRCDARPMLQLLNQ